jgi:outer membrane cobalamin receptor
MWATACVIALTLPFARAHAQVPGEVRGVVTDARTSQLVNEARIDVVGRSDVARTGADGAFVLRGLEPRAYTLRVRALGYAAKQFDITIENGRSTTLDVGLDPTTAALSAVVVRAARDTQPLNATTFDRQAIEASHRRDVGELLRSAPGVVITQAGGAGAATHVSIRGSSANEVLVLLDGVPMNSAISGDVDLSTIPLETVERVTVLSGAQSARYGERALAGVVQIETRRPSHEASGEVRGGAFGEHSVSASVGETRALGESGLRAGGSLTTDFRNVRGDFPYDVPSVRGGGTARRINSDVDSRNVMGMTTLDGGAWSGTARGAWQSMERGLAGSIVQPSTTGRQQQSRVGGGLDLRGQRALVAWTISGDATHEHAAFTDTAPPFGTRYNDTVNATALTSSASATLGHSGLAATLGSEARSLDVRTTLLAAGSPHWQRMLGAYANVRGSRALNDAGTRIDAEIGGRLDENSLINETVGSPRASLSLTQGVFVGSVTYAGGFAPPTLADEFFHEGVLVRPNPDLQPERTRNDIEGRLALREAELGPISVNGQASVYRADVDGMILWFPDFRFIWSPSNFDVHRSGWELSGRAALLRDIFDVQGTFNRSDVEYTGPVLSGQVAYRPSNTANITVGAKHRAVRLEMANDYVGERRTVPGSALNTLDPYWRTDIRLTATITRPRWTLDGTLGVENLFNKSAAMLVDYPFPSRDWTVGVRIRRGGLGATQ